MHYNYTDNELTPAAIFYSKKHIQTNKELYAARNFAGRKICLIDKDIQEAFYVNLIDDFWGNKPFTLGGNSKIWSEVLIESSSTFSVKKQFEKALEQDSEMKPEMKEKLKDIISATNEYDNNVVFKYTLK